MTSSSINLSNKTAQLMGYSGIFASLVLFVGDMLFYYQGESNDLIVNLSYLTDERIIASGATALIAAWFYVLAAGQIYYAFAPAKSWQRLSLFFSFLAIMIAYGVVHSAFVAIATSAKIAHDYQLPLEELTQLAIQANQVLRQISYLPFAIFTLVFIPLVWKGQSRYPRWMVFASPIIPFLLAGFVIEALSGQWKTIISGGYLNLILLIFFSLSSYALRLDRTKATALEH